MEQMLEIVPGNEISGYLQATGQATPRLLRVSPATRAFYTLHQVKPDCWRSDACCSDSSPYTKVPQFINSRVHCVATGRHAIHWYINIVKMYTVVNSTIEPREKGVAQSLAHDDASPHSTHYLWTVYNYSIAWRPVATPFTLSHFD
ncbi:hypothetical protein EVAR_82420_1 [Eumeta japonica]|uniref:Uncharacterized protein n=1 Tax=Eumeta variegata TaxID=151549 RepID=A0A4C1YJK3_EUMVA|nr:hypothetical protein EVAR_82420_1 [Eumeta japonica]